MTAKRDADPDQLELWWGCGVCGRPYDYRLEVHQHPACHIAVDRWLRRIHDDDDVSRAAR
ncbi:hypothetical protein [Mycobacterium szulgai]|uniref:C2H2-type domain-containing protein n=1 Tax=Mycobacterium szulgai TaxID=1787 RepID=A0A1X2DKX4_MYCSZ|nr:hypothetical protein [Mycobacterium szulgai]MCV7076711.1 hypothetical protein [Mycobacterium szulgai]ORW88788.1 hypothetical protein AWC27_13900 [Mycobacterium szulgai]